MLRQILLASFMICGLCYGAGESTKAQKSSRTSIPQKTTITKKNQTLFKTLFKTHHTQCLQGNGMSCLYVAQRLLHNVESNKSDITNARIYYHRACNLGVQIACDEYKKIALPQHLAYRIFIRQLASKNRDDEQIWLLKRARFNGALGMWLK